MHRLGEGIIAINKAEVRASEAEIAIEIRVLFIKSQPLANAKLLQLHRPENGIF